MTLVRGQLKGLLTPQVEHVLDVGSQHELPSLFRWAPRLQE